MARELLIAARVFDDLNVRSHGCASCAAHDLASSAFRALRTTFVRQAQRPMVADGDKVAQGKRLRAARERAGFKSATDGWTAVRQRTRSTVSKDSYIQHENGTRSLKGRATLYATAYGVEAEWLVWGKNPPEGDSEPLVPIIGLVGADSSGEVVQTTGQLGSDMVPVPPGGSSRAVALEVAGSSMLWLAAEGSLVYFENQRTPPTEDMVYYPVIAELDDGRVLLKRLLRGSAPGLWTLESQLGPPIENVRIVWAAEPIAIIPPRQAQRIIRRSGESQVA